VAHDLRQHSSPAWRRTTIAKSIEMAKSHGVKTLLDTDGEAMQHALRPSRLSSYRISTKPSACSAAR
jgi:hypothetical protein